MKKLTQGLLLTLLLAFAATAHAQNGNITIDFDKNALTGHDINEAIWLAQKMNVEPIYLGEPIIVTMDNWECEEGETPPNCTLTGTQPRRAAPRVDFGRHYYFPLENQAPPVPHDGGKGKDEDEDISPSVDAKKLVCQIAAGVAGAAGMVWGFSGSNAAPQVIDKIASETLKKGVTWTVSSITRTPQGLLVVLSVLGVATATTVILCVT